MNDATTLTPQVEPGFQPAPATASNDFQPDAEPSGNALKGGVRPRRRMIDLYWDLAAPTGWIARTRTYGWEKADELIVDPNNGAKLIFPDQWIESMRVAAALFTRPRIRALGAPEAVAHPCGRAGLAWHDGGVYFTVLLAAHSRGGSLACEWERKDARGVTRGKSRDERDLGHAVESAFTRS